MSLKDMIMKKAALKIIDSLGYTVTKKSAWDNISDFVPEASAAENAMMDTALKYSMGNKARMWSLLQSVKHVHANKIEGDIVECGVWAGGNIILSALACSALGEKRTHWAYDTYTGMSAPTDVDVNAVDNKAAQKKWENSNQGELNSWCLSTIEQVTQNVQRELGTMDNIKFIKGMVENTLADPKNIPEKISILRLDTDFYESTKMELEVLYPRLQLGGC
jgi:O-methyltransferase